MLYNFFKKKKEQIVADNNEKKYDDCNVENLKKEPIKMKDGLILVKDNEIVVKDPIDNGKKANLFAEEGIILKINDTIVREQCEVLSNDKIEFEIEKKDSKRVVHIRIEDNNMCAAVDIKYYPRMIFKLKEKQEASVMILEKEIEEEVFPPKFTAEELIEELKAKGIVFGLIDDNIKKAISEFEVKKLVVAQGRDVLNDIDDSIEYFFEISENNLLEEDSEGSIDYKSIGHVKHVVDGQVLCQLIKGTDGEDGVDVFGKAIKKKAGKRLNLSCGENVCIEEDKVIALSDGKAYLKNGKISVVKLHEIASDVDIKTGNISFVGDIVIHGEVKDNMKVNAGHGVEIYKNALEAIILAEGDIKINGNVIHSKIISGGNYLAKTSVIEDLNMLKSNLEDLFHDIDNIRQNNLMSKEITDGQLVFTLLEKKYKNIPKLCTKLIKSNKYINGKVIVILKVKLLDIAPLSIKHYTEISEIISSLDENSKILSYELDVTHNVELQYSQDSQIQCTGNVYIHGKGEYISNIMANDSVIFSKNSSIARGGMIKATNMIKCGVVGSEVGVSTTLTVGAQGHIYAEVAYNNTTLIVGAREFTLDKSYRQVHAYLNHSGELIVDKFVL